jgi:hypothetical protein
MWNSRGGGSSRVCLFGHKWTMTRIDRNEFLVHEECTWCGRGRERPLRPEDEQAFEQIRRRALHGMERDRLKRELRCEAEKGRSADQTRIREIQVQLKELG